MLLIPNAIISWVASTFCPCPKVLEIATFCNTPMIAITNGPLFNDIIDWKNPIESEPVQTESSTVVEFSQGSLNGGGWMAGNPPITVPTIWNGLLDANK